MPIKLILYIFAEFRTQKYLQNSKFSLHSYKRRGWSEIQLFAIKRGNQYWKYYPLPEKIFMKDLRLKFLSLVI